MKLTAEQQARLDAARQQQQKTRERIREMVNDVKVPPFEPGPGSGWFSAYLLMRLRPGPLDTPVLMDVGIYSEPTPTSRDVGEFYACILRMQAPTYQDAKLALEAECARRPSLRWVLSWLVKRSG